MEFDISEMDKIILFLKASKLTVFNRIENIQAHPSYSRIIKWGKLISVTTAAQLLIQTLGFISGILIIRFLPVEEYALYTLANAFLGTITILGDGGISAGVLSQGGKEWQNKEKLGAIMATGLQMRKKFAVYSLLLSLPILSYLLLENGASWLTVLLIIITLIPAFYAQLSDSLWEIVPKLHQNIPALQKNQLAVGFGRLLLTVSLVLIFPLTFIALIANGMPRIYGNIKLRKIAAPYITPQKPDVQVKKEIYKTVKRILPGAIYYCLSGQITIWILSIFGNTSGLAQLGALAKFAVLLTVFHTLIGTVVVPRFARLVQNAENLMNYYVSIISAVFFFVTFIVIGVSLIPNQILWVLGENYANLQIELVLTIIGGSIGLVASTSYALNISRNWVLNPLMSISINLVSMAIGLFIFDVSQLKGVLFFNIFLTIIQLFMNALYGFFKIKKESMALL